MNRKTKLLALTIAILIVLLSVETYTWQTMDKNANQAPIRVACVGDSITAGTAYPDDLWLMLGSKYVLGNFGANGATIYLGSDNPYAFTPAFNASEQFQPQIVIIMLGTNDANPALNESNAEFIKTYTWLVSQFKGLESKPKVWIVKPPPILANDDGLNGTYLEQNIIPDIEQVANATGASVIDVYNAMIGHPAYFPDGVHPNNEGSEALADIIYTAILSAEKSA